MFERNDVLILNEYFLAILKPLGATNNPRSSDVITLLRGFMWTQPSLGEKLCRNDTANCGKIFIIFIFGPLRKRETRRALLEPRKFIECRASL